MWSFLNGRLQYGMWIHISDLFISITLKSVGLSCPLNGSFTHAWLWTIMLWSFGKYWFTSMFMSRWPLQKTGAQSSWQLLGGEVGHASGFISSEDWGSWGTSPPSLISTGQWLLAGTFSTQFFPPALLVQNEHAREALRWRAAEACCRKPLHALDWWMPQRRGGPPTASATFTVLPSNWGPSCTLIQGFPRCCSFYLRPSCAQIFACPTPTHSSGLCINSLLERVPWSPPF